MKLLSLIVFLDDNFEDKVGFFCNLFCKEFIGFTEIIIISNPKVDMSIFKFLSDKDYIIIRNYVSVSQIQAFSQGLMRATGDYVMFLIGIENLSFNLVKVLNQELDKVEYTDIAVIPEINVLVNSGETNSFFFEKNYYDKKFQPNKKIIMNVDNLLCLSNKIFYRNFLMRHCSHFFGKNNDFYLSNFLLHFYTEADRIIGLPSVKIDILNFNLISKIDKKNLVDYLYKNFKKFLINIQYESLEKSTIFNVYLPYQRNAFIDDSDITIIIPVYNSAIYLYQCLQSILNQNLEKIRILAVNDGSSDKSYQILNDVAKSSDRLIMIDCNRSSGHPGTPRNIALCLTQSKFVMFVDADDYLLENGLGYLFEECNLKNLDICSTNGFFKVINDNKIEKCNFDYLSKQKKEDIIFLQNKFFSNIWNRLYRTSLIFENGVFFPSLYLSEDLCFSALVHYYANRTGSIDHAIYFYRYENVGSTTDQRRGENGFLIVDLFSEELRYLKKFNTDQVFFIQFLQKQLDSFWYTHDRLDCLLRPLFKHKMRTILLPFKNSFRYDLLSNESRGRLKALLENDQKSSSGLLLDGVDLYRMKKGFELQHEKKYQEAQNIFKRINNTKISLHNRFLTSLLQKDFIKAKLFLQKLKEYPEIYKDCRKKFISNFDIYKPSTVNNLHKKNDPLLSIIIPVYNSEKYIKDCLDSVIAQSYENLEIIIINDGSRDSSLEIINNYIGKDHRIKLINNTVSSGNPGKPRNIGLNFASGEYIGFVDSDDILSVDYYQNFINVINDASIEVDLVFSSGYYDFIENKKSTKIYYNNSYFDDVYSVFYRYHQSFTIWDKVYRLDFLRSNEIFLAETKAAVDVPFVFKCYIKASSVLYCKNNFGYHYRRESESSVTVNRRKKTDCSFEFEVYDELLTWISKDECCMWYRPIIDLKKISSYLYALNLIDRSYRQGFYTRARLEMLCFDDELMLDLLSLLEQTEKMNKFKKILKMPFYYG